MRIDQTRCDRCGFAKDNPCPTFIASTVIKMRRAGDGITPSGIDVTTDLCVRCFDEVQAAVTVAMAKP